ncbi:MAG: hypothetical protein LBN39_01140, partial [Planctomycetaceae bacterium]|nr:hypothetical protein [Planctomycetaceae bacterium]
WKLWTAVKNFFFDYVPGFTPDSFMSVQKLYEDNAFISIFTAAFTPIPYKIFTITAGVCEIPILTLIAASIIGRGGRFYFVALLMYLFGPTVERWIDRYFNTLTLVFTVLLIGGFVLLNYAFFAQTSDKELYLKDVLLNDSQLSATLKEHPNVQRLTLRRLPNITEYRYLPPLRNLALIEMSMSADALQQIVAQEKIAALDLRFCTGLNAADYQLLQKLKTLTDLKIGGSTVTDDVLGVIAVLPKLTGLTLDDAPITSAGFAEFADKSSAAATLKTLVLNRNSALFDDALLTVKKFPKLERLTVCGMMTTGEFLAKIADNEKMRPKLKRLSLRKTLLTAEYAAALNKYPELVQLDLSGNGIDAETATVISALTNLQEIDLRDCQLDDEVLEQFRKMKCELILGSSEKR